MNIEVLHFDQDIHVKLLHWQRRGALNTQILTELLAVFAADQEKISYYLVDRVIFVLDWI